MSLIDLSYLLPLCLAGIGLGEPQATSTEDLIVIDVAPALREELRNPPAGSRLLLYLVDAKHGPAGEPADGPSRFAPHLIASWDLRSRELEMNLDSGELRAHRPDLAHPRPPSELSGSFRAQAVIHLRTSGPGPSAAGNLVGAVSWIDLDPDHREIIRLTLDRVRPKPPTPEHGNVIPIQRPSRLLPRASEKSATQRAWVVLPRRYHDINARRRFWPTIYVLPDHGASAKIVDRIADLLARRETAQIMPQAIWVVLDPVGPMGHHYFIDSPTNGARRRALVEEMIPWIEVRFRAVAEPDARLLLGEGAGARAALGLLAAHPETFARAWAISPEAITFSQLGALDLYDAKSAYEGPEGSARPAVRSPLGTERDRVHANVRDEVLLAHTISPGGRSGTVWDAWRAAFGRPTRGAPLPPWPFDLETGRIDPVVVKDWSTHDLLLEATSDPAVAESLRARARIVVGGRDEFYRNRGVAALADVLGIDSINGDSQVIRIDLDATSNEVSALGRMRSYDAMIEHLKSHDLHD